MSGVCRTPTRSLWLLLLEMEWRLTVTEECMLALSALSGAGLEPTGGLSCASQVLLEHCSRLGAELDELLQDAFEAAKREKVLVQ